MTEILFLFCNTLIIIILSINNIKFMRKSCCSTIQCNNLENELENCGKTNNKKWNICCEYIEFHINEIYNSSCKCNKKITIKICENTFNNLISKVKCETKSGDFEIIGCVLIGIYFYIYIQSKDAHKNNILCVIQGKIDNTTHNAIDNSLNIQMCYNLYNAAKNARLDKKNIKIVQVLYNPYDDLFILLINNNNKTLIAKIEHLEAIHSVGTAINFIYTDACNFSIINDIPISMCVVEKGKYKITYHDLCEKQNKYIFVHH